MSGPDRAAGPADLSKVTAAEARIVVEDQLATIRSGRDPKLARRRRAVLRDGLTYLDGLTSGTAHHLLVWCWWRVANAGPPERKELELLRDTLEALAPDTRGPSGVPVGAPPAGRPPTAPTPSDAVRGALCGESKAVARRTWERLRAAPSLNLGFREESFTEFNLFDLQAVAGTALEVHKFTTAQEPATGADWRWYLHLGAEVVTLRIQAKKAYVPDPRNPRWRYGELVKPRSRAQLRRLVLDARRAQEIPLYVLYTYTDEPAAWSTTWSGEPALFGCSLCSPWTAFILAHVQGESAVAAFAPYLTPWSTLFCAGAGGGPRAWGSAAAIAGHVAGVLAQTAEPPRQGTLADVWEEMGAGPPGEYSVPAPRPFDAMGPLVHHLAEGDHERLDVLEDVEPGVYIYTRLPILGDRGED